MGWFGRVGLVGGKLNLGWELVGVGRFFMVLPP